MSDSLATIFIVDDNASVLKAMERMLRTSGLKVVAYASAREFFEQYDPNIPGCLVLDIAMPGMDGLELQKLLIERGETLPIIFLTAHGDVSMSVQALKRGASDFLLKPVDEAELLDAISAALKVDNLQRQNNLELSEIRQRLESLTPRECQVLQLVIAGKLNKQIAAELGMAEKTVKVHREHIKQKLKVRSAPELLKLCEMAGMALPCQLKS